MSNQFGRRYITPKAFLDYARELDLFTDQPSQRLLEFLERHGSLDPVARIRFPPEIVRRWHRQRHPGADMPHPIEGDTQRLAVATALYDEVFNARWNLPEVYGERPHPLDTVAPEHAPFVQTCFDPRSFVPWKKFRTVVQIESGREIGDNGLHARTCYHYWQVFPLAAFLRSGITILYDLKDDALRQELRELRIGDTSRAKLWTTINLDARHELRKIAQNASLFDAVAWFEAYRRNALRLHASHAGPRTRRLPCDRARAYRRSCCELARDAVGRYAITSDQLLTFTKFQCELWCTAKSRGPAKLADEYARNIDSTIQLYREVSLATYEQVIERVGRAGSHFKPILKVIFPDWLDEPRDLVERSLQAWIVPSMTGLHAPFALSDADIGDFRDWIEQHGLFQFYWHFKRLTDLGFGDWSRHPQCHVERGDRLRQYDRADGERHLRGAIALPARPHLGLQGMGDCGACGAVAGPASL